jgi:3-oxoacyl-[acyl-carrier-protein] synthase-3
MEVLSASGVCASSMAALRAAAAGVRLGEHDVAAVVGSELISRALKASRFDPETTPARSGFDAEFLRWTLSDGAAAVVLEPRPRPDGLSLRVDWTHLVSVRPRARHLHACGLAIRRRSEADGGGPQRRTWLDYPTVAEAERAGLLRLRQDVRALPELFGVGLREFVTLVRDGKFDPREVDHVLCHYSAEHFKADIFKLLRDADLMIDEERWFTNLHTRGNTGAASIFVMLEECWRTKGSRPAIGSS